MRKMFCDKCGKEIAEKNAYLLDVNRRIVQFPYEDNDFPRKDLCEDCANEVMAFINQDDAMKG